MGEHRRKFLAAGLATLHRTGLDRLIGRWIDTAGYIFMLHRVQPECPDRPANQWGFSPNRFLSITPDFLEQVIVTLKNQDIDCISLDDACERLKKKDFRRRFACFTLDDGYRDNRDWAYPVFARHNVPFTIYVCSSFAGQRGQVWWMALEHMILGRSQLEFSWRGETRLLDCRTPQQKQLVFEQLFNWLRNMAPQEQRSCLAAIADQLSFDLPEHCARLMLDWQSLGELANDPLVTLGGHTKSHFALARLPEAQARQEIAQGLAEMHMHLGQRPQHFCFPYGDRRSAGSRDFELVRTLGLTSAVTTRKGAIPAREDLNFYALPRISLNGEFQSITYLETLLTGTPFALLNIIKSKEHINGRKI